MHAAAAAPVHATHAPRGLVIIGHPVSHSLSPRFQNAALAHEEIPARYERRDVTHEQLDAVLAECRTDDIAGNVTIPHKEAVAARATRVSARAHRAGAVNTFWWEGDALIGHNTDVDGVRATIGALAPNGVQGPVVVLGSGGSAAAVLVGLDELGIRDVHLLARTRARAEALVQRVGVGVQVQDVDADLATPSAAVVELLAASALVINATPAGMQDTRHPVPLGWLGAQTAVFDLVYRQEGTAWVREARARGMAAEDGLRMLVEQGAAAFETWFARPAPRAVMWAALGHAMPAPDRLRD